MNIIFGDLQKAEKRIFMNNKRYRKTAKCLRADCVHAIVCYGRKPTNEEKKHMRSKASCYCKNLFSHIAEEREAVLREQASLPVMKK